MLLSSVLALAACTPANDADVRARVDAAVDATVQAQATPPVPTATPPPSATPISDKIRTLEERVTDLERHNPTPTPTSTPGPTPTSRPLPRQTATPTAMPTATPVPLPALPEFVIEELSESRGDDIWEVSGVIAQKGLVVRDLHLSRLLIEFCNIDGRPVDWQVPQADLARDIAEPIAFVLQIASAGWRDSGWGFGSFREFQDAARVCNILVQILEPRYALRYGENQYTGQFKADLTMVLDPRLLYPRR